MMSNVCNNRLLLRAGHLIAGRWPGRTRICAVPGIRSTSISSH